MTKLDDMVAEAIRHAQNGGKSLVLVKTAAVVNDILATTDWQGGRPPLPFTWRVTYPEGGSVRLAHVAQDPTRHRGMRARFFIDAGVALTPEWLDTVKGCSDPRFSEFAAVPKSP